MAFITFGERMTRELAVGADGLAASSCAVAGIHRLDDDDGERKSHRPADEAAKRSRLGRIEPLAQLFAGLEEGRPFGLDFHAIAGSRIAADPLVARLDRERAEAAKLDPVAVAQSVDDLLQYRVDDVLDVSVRKNILLSNVLDELRFDYGPKIPPVAA
jgi:hypothetical protein